MMVDLVSPIVIIGIILFIVLLINVGIFYRFRKGNDPQENKALKGMLKTMSSPWEKEDRDLDELAKLTDILKKQAQEKEEEN